jgi:Flp pilus assembly protein TadD
MVPAATPPFAGWEWLLLVALMGAVLLVYQPAWQGGLIWDDDAHVTRPELRSWHGLHRIWFELGATQQYYPLLHSVFWVQHKLWGDATLGYHLLNILLHAAVAVLVALVLRRLAVPGAYLAAAIFALHPVHVESVAWITELKNTLSGAFYLGAMLLYLGFDQSRRTWLYWGALGLFVLGLLSKTVTATLPAALLVIFWWQRGKLSWRRDVLPLVPFFALGVVAGVFTAWVERKLIGAEGAPFALTVVERCLIAGRAIWFYLGKLFWPAELIFIYPRWQVSQAVWWQYLFPAAMLPPLALGWAVRRRWRAPLAGLLFFVGTLLPVLGFCNVYRFLFSFVADHFQYLASLGMIAPASAGVALLLERWGLWHRPVGYAVCLTLLASLGILTWRQSRIYSGVDLLYRTTIARNPAWWLGYYNLGVVLAGRGRFDEAIALYQRAVELKPDYALAQNSLGAALAHVGQFDEALAHYRKALEVQPDYVLAHYNLGSLLADRGRFEEARAQYQAALKIHPGDALVHNNLGVALTRLGRFDEALAQYRKVLELKPNDAMAHYNLGNLSADRGQFEEALTHFQQALEIRPAYAKAHYKLSWLRATCPLASLRNGTEAIAHAVRANQLCEGRQPEVLDALAAACAEAGRFPEALAIARRALDVATGHDDQTFGNSLRTRIALYEAGKPFHQTPPAALHRPRP